MAYRIEITATALAALQRVSDRRTRAAIERRIGILAEKPEEQGNALRAELTGFYSVRAAGRRYRVVFRIDRGDGLRVIVVLVGIRREGSRQDVYDLALRLVRRGWV